MRVRTLAAGAWALAAAAAWASAGNVDYLETDDAGDLPASAATVGRVGDNILSITGGIASTTDADLFAVYVADPATFFASTNNAATLGDTQLFLFDSGGYGVVGIDDDENSLAATLDGFSGPAGVYYLAVSRYDLDPVSLGGLIFESQPYVGPKGPNGPGGGSPISGFDGIGSTGDYRIDLRGVGGTEAAVVPLPAPVFAGGVGLLALAATRRLRRR